MNTNANVKRTTFYQERQQRALKPQICINETYIPTVSTAYSQVRFNFVSNGIYGSTKSTTVNSIVVSHFYLEASSRCEYYKINSQKPCEQL